MRYVSSMSLRAVPSLDSSRRMKAQKRQGTKPEATVAKALQHFGFRFRRHVDTLPGKPDLVNGAHRVAIFVHGCFWHHHTGCKYATLPKANRRFWVEKLAGNKKRDRRKTRALRELGYRVLTVWECQTRTQGLDLRIGRFLEGL